ncbi:DUF501 domain-containing protein [Microcella flavibacter]|uniref:DUF501 domain-containing protein n=1 Tax=Microcella flavibacter TaxID=1804990 RepID=UPI00145634FE|nr:DUF501 domain-containing protein [Microcella flavibacter]
MSRPPFAPFTERDVEIVSAQLGRPARDVIGIPARCVCGAPTVVATRPRLGNGTPFPTLYYLTHPGATASASRLEASGIMAVWQAELGENAELAAQYAAAHEQYLADRESILPVPEVEGYSAGGMPTRVKCLHALLGHALAAGRGVNPIGDRALDEGDWSPEVCACAPDQRGA